MHLLPHRSLLRFLPPVAVFLFSAVVGISFAAWIDAPNAPPNYNIDPNCTPPCLQADFKPMNLGTTPQTKSAGAIFEGNLTANSFIDHDDPAYYIDPASNGYAGLFNGRVDINGNVGIGTTSGLAKLSINGGLHVGGDSDPGDNNALIDGEITASGFRDTEDPLYYLDPAAATGYSGLFAGKVGIRQSAPSASLAVNNPSTSDKRGSIGDAIYAYANNTNSAISAEQANAAGYAIYASGGINYFGGDVRVGSAEIPKNLCLNDDCKTAWPTAPAETDPKVSGGTTSYLTKWTGTATLGNSVIYDNGNVGIGTTDPAAKLHVVGGSAIVDNGWNFATKNLAGLQANLIGVSGATVQIGSNGLGDIVFYGGIPTSNKGFRMYPQSTRPVCTSDLVGTMYTDYDVNNFRLSVCVRTIFTTYKWIDIIYAPQ